MKRKLSLILALCILTAGGCSSGKESANISFDAASADTAAADSAGYSGGESRVYYNSIYEEGDFSYSEDYSYYDHYEAAEADTICGESCEPIRIEPSCEPYEPKQQIQPQAGLLTGGEWNDNRNFDFWAELLGQRSGWTGMSNTWGLYTLNRTKVHVTDEKGDAKNVTVTLEGDNGVIWTAVTDNTGTAYLFHSVNPAAKQLPNKLAVQQNGQILGEFEYNGKSETELVINAETAPARNLDLMFVIDSTGSMGDEISYLKSELTGVIERIARERQTAIRLCTEVYRDEDDDYVVKSCEFTFNIDAQTDFLDKQFASGGGDYPEAVVEALEAAVHEQKWDSSAAQLMFLVLDAPPHYTKENISRLRNITAEAAKKGIRIIPVAASGVDTDTEFLCRSLAVLTGGTYTFLTDHSGIGNSHLEPTVGYYQVEKLNEMLVRIIESYL